MSAQTKTFEQRLAALVRLLASDVDGEALAAARALKRLLASRDADLNDLAGGIEKLATGGLRDAEMKRIFEAGYAKGAAETRSASGEVEPASGKRADGSTDWLASARPRAFGARRSTSSSPTWRRE